MFDSNSDLSKTEAAGRYVSNPTATNMIELMENYDVDQEEIREYQQAALGNIQYQSTLEEAKQQLRSQKVDNWTDLLEEGASGSVEALGSTAQTGVSEAGETLGSAGRTTFEDVIGETAVGARNAYDKVREGEQKAS